MPAQPGLYLGVLVGGVVVQDHMQPPPRVGLGDELEEVQELAVAVPWLAGVGDRAGGHLQRREQRGRVVPEVVVGAPLGPARPYRADRLGPLQRLDLGLLVHPDHDRMRRRVQIQPDHVADPGLQLRVGGDPERLGLPGPDVMLGPHPRHRAVADAQLGSQQP
jgi:hypothetical protein